MPSGAVPFPFGKCRICCDKATGIHYGVATCEGCKGFFKRSITKAEKYRCFFGGKCTLTPKNRNRCKSCRFKRCMDTGMALEAVKMGRIPKVEKERALEEERDKIVVEDGDEYEDIQCVEKQPSGSTSSGFISDETSPKDDSKMETECVPDLHVFPKSENVTLPGQPQGFPQYPPTSGTFCPVFPRPDTSNGFRDRVGSNHIQSEHSVSMDHSGAYRESQIPQSETKREIPNGREQFLSPRVASVKNGIKTGENKLGNGIISHAEAGTSAPNGKHADKIASVGQMSVSHVPPPIEMKSLDSMPRRQMTISPESLGRAGLIVQTNQRGSFSSWPSAPVVNGHCGDQVQKDRLNDYPEQISPKEVKLDHGSTSPGMTPTSVYNSEVIKQLFTHALENICQDGMKAQLMEKFLSSDPDKYGATAQFVNSMTPSSCSSTSSDRKPSRTVQELCKQTVSNQMLIPATDSGDHSKVHEVHFRTNRKLPQINPSQLNVSNAAYTMLRANQTIQSSPSGMHRLPFSVPHMGAMVKQTIPLRPGHNLPPSTQVSTSQTRFSMHRRAMELDSPDWYDSWSDSLFDERDAGKSLLYQKGGVENMRALPHMNIFQQVKIKQEPVDDFQNLSCPFNRSAQNTNGDTNVLHGQIRKGQFLKSDATNPKIACLGSAASSENSRRIERLSDDIQIIERIFSDIAASSQTDEIQLNDNDPMIPPISDDWFPVDDINVEILNDESLTDEELVHHLEKWYLKIEVFSVKMTKLLHAGLKDGTCLENVIPLDGHKPKRQDAEFVWKLLFQNVEPCGVRVANFCKIIPGFSRVSSDDQDILVTTAFFDLWMICHSPLFHDGEVHIIFPQSPKTKYCRYWMGQFLPKELIDRFFNFCDVFNSCNLSTAEVAIIMAVRATLPERPGLKDVEVVKKLNTCYLNLMVQTIVANHLGESGIILKKIFMALPQLHDINDHQNKVIGSFRLDQLPCLGEDEPS